jgi:polyhydroxyalkanoate synthesis repressor PhaR
MRVIKRYPNRKLYDTEAKAYITLNGIAALIRGGEEVQVVANTSGEDLTTLVLTQVILEQEKKQGGYLPRSVLTGLVRAGGDTLTSLRRSLVSPLDLLRQVDEEIDHRLQSLFKRGELAEEEVRRLRDKLLGGEFPLSRRSEPSDEALVQALAERGVPTRDEFERLTQQIEALAEKLDDLGQGTD